jgi:hypothetical protein
VALSFTSTGDLASFLFNKHGELTAVLSCRAGALMAGNWWAARAVIA